MGEDAVESYEMAVRITTAKRPNEMLFDEAAQYYNRMIDESPSNGRAWKARGNLLFKNGKMNAAISSYVRAVELEPENPKLHNLLGIALRKTNQLEAALESLNNATQLDPMFIEAWNNMGNTLYHLGRLHDAVKAYNRAIEINPDYRSALVNRRRCIQQLKSDDRIESVPLKSSVKDYMMVIEEYRNQGYKVDILENLLQDGKPNIIMSGFEDYKKRVTRLKEAEEQLADLDLDPAIKDQLLAMMRDPSSLNLVLRAMGKRGIKVEATGTMSKPETKPKTKPETKPKTKPETKPKTKPETKTKTNQKTMTSEPEGGQADPVHHGPTESEEGTSALPEGNDINDLGQGEVPQDQVPSSPHDDPGTTPEDEVPERGSVHEESSTAERKVEPSSDDTSDESDPLEDFLK